MTDSANVVYGRLKEAAHLSGYTFNRTSEWLETLLADDGWRHVGPGFTDVNVFLRSIDLSPFNIGDNRPALVRRIKELQPDASNRAIANAVGASEPTVRRDLRPASSDANETLGTPSDLQEHADCASNDALDTEPVLFPDSDSSDGELDEPEVLDHQPQPDDEPEPERSIAHVGRNTGDNEWYTPAEYIKAATAVLGAIDLDPASSEAANEVVGAASYYTEDDDGLTQPWEGRLWMNPPYAQPWCDRFCTRMAREYKNGSVTEAVVLVNNGTETNWFQEVAGQATAVCFPRGRVRFWHPGKDSASPLQGQAVIYLGSHPDKFRAEFLRFGFVVMAHG